VPDRGLEHLHRGHRVSRGTKPGDIPVEQLTKFELVINLTAAKVLRIDIPPTPLARADEVITTTAAKPRSGGRCEANGAGERHGEPPATRANGLK
jgi:hypothetical protein